MKRLIFILIGLIIITALVVLGVRYFSPNQTEEQNNDQSQKNAPELEENIRISSPQAMQKVTSPITIKGEARGSWFFEGVFSAKVLDENGKKLGERNIQSQGDWMTDQFVSFQGQIEFSTPTTTTGQVVLEKSNPSGKPQNSEKRVIVVEFPEADTGRR